MHKPGDLIFYDFRPLSLIEKSLNPANVISTPVARVNETAQVKVMQWNIERGYKYPEIVSACLKEQPDIICLQEIDINCERSGCRDVIQDLARELGMNAVMVVEFIELHHGCRSRANAVRNSDLKNDCGFHGNAILTKWDIANVEPILHKYQPFNWARDGHIVNEPRTGARYSLAANIETPHGYPLRCYSVHLEVFCGITGRLAQFSEILRDSRRHSKETPSQIIGADLNTMAHGIARLAPSYCSDMLRWKTFGQTEAEFWSEYILSFGDDDGLLNTPLQAFFYENITEHVPVFEEPDRDKCDLEDFHNEDRHPLSPLNVYTELSAFAETSNPSAYQRSLDTFFIDIRNNEFDEPFDTSLVTLKNYWGLYEGKLDWLLLRKLKLVSKHVGNNDFSASDHKYLCVSILHDPSGGYPNTVLEEKKNGRLKKSLGKKTSKLRTYSVPIILAAVLGFAFRYHK